MNIISFRTAIKIENPEGIPLAHSFSDSGIALDGSLLLTYEPPVASLGTLSIGVVCRINKTTISFGGTLESDNAGDEFKPSQDLIGKARDAVNEWIKDDENIDQSLMADVRDLMLNYCMVNVPIRQVYESLRINYPQEYRRLNMSYRTRFNKTIDMDIESLILKQQQSHKYGSNNQLIKTAFKDKDIVTLNKNRLNNLKTTNPQIYEKITQQLKEVEPVNGKYLVFGEPKNEQVQLVGIDPSSKEYVRTDEWIPESYFEGYTDKSDELKWMSPDQKKYFGVEDESPQQTNQQQTNQQTQQQSEKLLRYQFKKQGIPWKALKDKQLGDQFKEQITDIYNHFKTQGIFIPSELERLINKPKDAVEVALNNEGIDIGVLQSLKAAQPYKRQLMNVYYTLKQQRKPMSREFLGLINYWTSITKNQQLSAQKPNQSQVNQQ